MPEKTEKDKIAEVAYFLGFKNKRKFLWNLGLDIVSLFLLYMIFLNVNNCTCVQYPCSMSLTEWNILTQNKSFQNPYDIIKKFNLTFTPTNLTTHEKNNDPKSLELWADFEV